MSITSLVFLIGYCSTAAIILGVEDMGRGNVLGVFHLFCGILLLLFNLGLIPIDKN